MTTSDQEDQADKRRTLLNDARARNQSNGDTGTYLSHTHDEIGGRFAAIGHAQVVGAGPVPKYPAASTPWHGPDPVGDEPPLGFPIDAMPGLESSMATSSSSVEATGDPADAPSSDDGSPATPSGGLMSERAGSLSSNKRGE